MADGRPLGRERRWRVWLALFALTFVVHVTSPNVVVSDSLRSVPVAESILRRGTISLDHYRGRLPTPGYGVDIVDGHLYPTFPWAKSLFAVPVVAVFDGLHAVGIGPGVKDSLETGSPAWQVQVLTMSAVVALTTVVIYEIALLGLTVADARRRRRLALAFALVFSFCTSAWSIASRSLWQHGPSMLFLSLALLVALQSRTRPGAIRWLGLPLAAAYTMRPTNAIPLAAFSIWVAIRHRRHLVAYAAGIALVLGAFVAVNLSAWGIPLPPYYSANRLWTSRLLPEALVGNLFSPARGLFVFTPVLVLALAGVGLKLRRRQLKGLDLVVLASVVAHWLVISTMTPPGRPGVAPYAWWGGHSYGPRFFSDMAPFLIFLSLPVLDWLGTPGQRRASFRAVLAISLVLTGASFLIHFQGAYFRSSWCWNDQPTNIDVDQARLWDWSDPQFLRGAHRFLLGPDRRSEIMRAAAVVIGCPSEPPR